MGNCLIINNGANQHVKPYWNGNIHFMVSTSNSGRSKVFPLVSRLTP